MKISFLIRRTAPAVLMTMVCCAIISPVSARADIDHLLPQVKRLEVAEGSLPLSGMRIIDPRQTPSLPLYLADCGATLDPDGPTPVTVEYVDSIPGAFRHCFADWPDEEYSLTVTPSAIAIRAVTAAGVARAAQTLAQLAIGRDGSLPCVVITDWPAFKVRGFMHDAGRSYMDYSTLLRHIDLLARFKINTFHWHLTENQAWRFEVEGYPQLTSTESMTRHPGRYYTQQQCANLAAYAAARGVTVIPEIDMPGHSDAFTRAMGFSMQTDSGVVVLKEVLRQVARTFPDAPYIHIGADEVALTYPGFLDIITDYVHDELHRKVAVWNPIRGYDITPSSGFDLTTTWHPTGRCVRRMPNIDTRYNYTNLMDVFADPAGLYLSSIYHEPQGTADIVGSIAATWNDRLLPSDAEITSQNNLYAVMLANSERAWAGGRRSYFEESGARLPLNGDDLAAFADWERRFLLHKEGILRHEPIPYVRQADIRWRITEPMPNGGDVSTVLPPEISEPALTYTLDGRTYSTTEAVGAAVYLRHSWGDDYVHPLFPDTPDDSVTAYAYTYVYSPVEQTAGALIEFQTYGRSEVYPAPQQGCWDLRGSNLWLNDERIVPPAWTGDTDPAEVDREDLLGNQNLSARKPVAVNLRQGWNKVLLKLPFRPVPYIRLNQWMFTFVITDPVGRNALSNIVYSPDRKIPSVD